MTESAAGTATKRSRASLRDVSSSELIARKLAKVAPNEDPAQVAGAIAIFAAETIKRSAGTLMEARAYLEGLRTGIDGLLRNAFPESTRTKKKQASGHRSPSRR
jgi:hypothetical protein